MKTGTLVIADASLSNVYKPWYKDGKLMLALDWRLEGDVHNYVSIYVATVTVKDRYGDYDIMMLSDGRIRYVHPAQQLRALLQCSLLGP